MNRLQVNELRTQDIDVYHYDKHNLIATKPQGMMTTKGKGDELSFQECISQIIDKPARPLHRLDYGTSGLVVTGLTKRGRSVVTKQFEEGDVSKLYLAVVDGFEQTEKYININLPISHRWQENVAFVDKENGREARTECLVLAREVIYNSDALLLVKIHTGRTHQIRVHLRAAGFPVHGDRKYNQSARGYDQHLLHSSCLGLFLPYNNKRDTFCSTPNWLPENLVDMVNSKIRFYADKPNLRG
jgi:23S rRNA-/tRNA-specific pseudouridylate synthase